jgi:hypothetical protein
MLDGLDPAARDAAVADLRRRFEPTPARAASSWGRRPGW